MGIQYTCTITSTISEELEYSLYNRISDYYNGHFLAHNGIDVYQFNYISEMFPNNRIVILAARTEDFRFRNSDITKHSFLNGHHLKVESVIDFPDIDRLEKEFITKHTLVICDHKEQSFVKHNGDSVVFQCDSCDETIVFGGQS